jgi:hypothetical protein
MRVLGRTPERLLILKPYVDLDRQFVVLPTHSGSEEELTAYLAAASRSMSWPALLERRRIVMLAESRAGKSCELEHIVAHMRTEEKAAFFIRLDDLAEMDLTGACAPVP